MSVDFNWFEQKTRRQSLRNNATPAERQLWTHLKGKGLKGFKFRRQYGVGSFILDFYCPAAKLGIEIDGDSHFLPDKIEYDKRRTNFINYLGIKIIRFTNDEVHTNVFEVLKVIGAELEASDHP